MPSGIFRSRALFAAVVVFLASLVSNVSAQVGAGGCYCDASGTVRIGQLIGAVRVALGDADCPQPATGVTGVCFCDASGTISISQLIRAVNVALGRVACLAPATASPLFTASPVVTASPTSTAGVRDCSGAPDGTTCDAGQEGTVLTCFAGECGPCEVRADADPRFVDNGDGTVSDRRTCLVWEQKTEGSEFLICEQVGDCPDPHASSNLYTWSASGESFDGTTATLFLAELNDPAHCFAGHCDWRLPEIGTGPQSELRSLSSGPDSGGVDPIFGPSGRVHWSATTVPGVESQALAFDHSRDVASRVEKTQRAQVRAVRGTPPDPCNGKSDGITCDAGVDGAVFICLNEICSACEPTDGADPRYVDNGDGTITDRQTCLVWEKKTGEPGDGISCFFAGLCPDLNHVNNRYAWSFGPEAPLKTAFLDQLNGFELRQRCFADHCDWRLPSQEGLNSPMDGGTELQNIMLPPPCSGSDHCLDPIFDPSAGAVYWSSSTLTDTPGSAWGVDVSTGDAVAVAKNTEAYARAVRGAVPDVVGFSGLGEKCIFFDPDAVDAVYNPIRQRTCLIECARSCDSRQCADECTRGCRFCEEGLVCGFTSDKCFKPDRGEM
jgi:hypothetical protein